MKTTRILIATIAILGFLAGEQAMAQLKMKPGPGGLLGRGPQINPGLFGKLKPVPGKKPHPPAKPGNPPGNKYPWWTPLADPNTWLGLANGGHRPGWHPHHPHHPVDPGFDPNYDPGYDPGYNPGYDPGYDPGYRPGPAPLPENSLAAPVELLNPPETKAVIRCLLDGQLVELKPGEAKALPAGRSWVIEFHRGGNFGRAKYEMKTGLHWFRRSQNGWELFRGPHDAPDNGSLDHSLPTNPW